MGAGTSLTISRIPTFTFMKIYGKQTVTEPMAAMSRSGRYVHSYIITGAKGCGKKTAAAYIAQMLLCSDIHDGVPCGTCRECRRIEAQTHPDVILVEKSKTSFSVSDMRHIVADAYTSPNDCDRKVYIAADCDGWSDAAQAAMLKVTEDPPDPVYFIFTGADLSVFLPTLISRSMTIGITEDRDACVSFLRDDTPTRRRMSCSVRLRPSAGTSADAQSCWTAMRSS